jgi:hypothetical protein
MEPLHAFGQTAFVVWKLNVICPKTVVPVIARSINKE